MRTPVSRIEPWRKSSRSGGNEGGSNCVEVTAAAGRVGVRDSKAAGLGTLNFHHGQWRKFITCVKGLPPHAAS